MIAEVHRALAYFMQVVDKLIALKTIPKSVRVRKLNDKNRGCRTKTQPTKMD